MRSLGSFLLIWCLSLAYAVSQSLDYSHRSSGLSAKPSNLWQQEGRPPKPQPTSKEQQQIRSARDAYADKVIGLGVPIEQIIENHLGHSNPPRRLPTGMTSIISPVPDEVVAVGTFDYFDFVLTPRHRAIYTEMHVAIDKVLYPANSAASGRVIDIVAPGGTVMLPDGRSLGFDTAPRAYGLSTQGRYVLFLRHMDPGDFYLLYDSIAIENGVSAPNSPDTASASLSGKWPFSNMKEDDLLRAIGDRLKAQHGAL